MCLALAGKRALVTGAGVGIGEGIALEFARQGAAVMLHYAFDHERAPQTAREICGQGGRAAAIQADLTEVSQCFRLVGAAAEFLGGLDLLVNNAGVTLRVPFLDLTPAQFDSIIHLNVRAYYFVAQRAVEHLAAQGRGCILNIASFHAHAGVPTYSLYTASKGAVIAFTRQLAAELIPQHIRVNALAPGHIEVPRHLANPNYTRAIGEALVPWGRVGTPQDVASAAAFLASDAAEFITGQILYVDGGTTTKLAATPVPWGR